MKIISRNLHEFDISNAGNIIDIEYFDGIVLDNESMLNITFKYCDFTNCSFDGCNLTNVCFVGCVFRNCSFCGCNLSSVRFELCTLALCYFTRARFDNTLCGSSRIVSCNFLNTIYYHTTFSACNIISSTIDDSGSGSFSTCYLSGSHFDGCRLPIGFDTHRFGEILEEDIVGWKKCIDDHDDGCIVKLLIPKGSVVFSINGKKCRTNKCKVLDIISCGDYRHLSRARSAFGPVDGRGLMYYPGDEINIKNFDMDYAKECATGIHFFKTKTAAWNYGIM